MASYFTPPWGTWTAVAASYVPSAGSIPAWLDPAKWSRKDAAAVYNTDGSIDGAATKEKREKEVWALLDSLHASAVVNNCVFALSAETEKYYARFVRCLTDTVSGVPTAYRDMDQLMREAGPTMEKQFASMPSFVQTFVTSLPARLGVGCAPELFAALREKPGADAKVEPEEASPKASQPGAGASTPAGGKKNPRRRGPGTKKRVQGGRGVVVTMLRSIVTFMTARFPLLASTANLAVGLAVFVLMLVFWCCRKRGKESRLEEESAGTASVDGGDDDGHGVSDSEEDDAKALTDA